MGCIKCNREFPETFFLGGGEPVNHVYFIIQGPHGNCWCWRMKWGSHMIIVSLKRWSQEQK